MHVARAVARGLREQRVDHADHGRVVLRVEQVGDGRNVLHQPRQVDLLLHGADHRSGIAGFGVALGEQAVHLRIADLPQRQPAQQAARLDHGPAGRARAHCEEGRVAVALHRDALAASPGLGQGGFGACGVHGATTSSGW
ncbi:hypothetical protein D9M72_595100 [compost metagenome]